MAVPSQRRLSWFGTATVVVVALGLGVGMAWLWSLVSLGAISEDPPTLETAQSTPSGSPTPEVPFAHRVPAPSLEGGTGWLNTAGPIRLADLRGKVVLLDFWTYCCINCMHMLPVLGQLEEKYANELVVIGVHSAKFVTEKETENIRQAILRYEISHPVINDSNLVIWRKYNVRAWPTLVVIDPEGYVVASQGGEIPFDILDTFIGRLVEHHREKGTLDAGPLHFDLERYREQDPPLLFPGKVLADADGGRLFIADSNHNRMVVATLQGEVLDVIGTGQIGADDGPFDQATFDHPQGMALDGHILYVADTENHLIRQVDLSEQTVTTIAGTGKQATFGVAGGPAQSTPLNSPWDMQLVEGKLYIAMAGPHQIWMFDLSSGWIAPYAGSGREDILDGLLAHAAMAQPSGITTDGQRLYVADSEGSAIRAVDLDPIGGVRTIVGPRDLPRGQSLFEFGDRDGIGSDVRLQHPLGIDYYEGQLYIADTYNNKIKVVDPVTGEARTLFGDGQPGDQGKPPRFDEPGGLSVADGRLYIADTNNHHIRVAELSTGQVTTLELSGLEPPRRASQPVQLSLPNAAKIKLGPQRVRADEPLVLAVSIRLPKGFKLNPQMPVRYMLEAEADTGVVERAAIGQISELQPPSNQFDIPVTLSGSLGQEQLRLSLLYYSCRVGAEAVCKMESVVWDIPLQVAESGSSNRIPLVTPRSDAH